MENYYENTKVENERILNNLILNASCSEVSDTLKLYDIAKPAASNIKKIKERSKADLEKTAEYLQLECSNQNKGKLALMILDRVATLLLEPCKLCNHYYSVSLNETPLLTCYFCKQGCHDQCYKTRYPEGFDFDACALFFICLSCEQVELSSRDSSTKHSKKSLTDEKVSDITVETNSDNTPKTPTATTTGDNGDKDTAVIPVCRFYKKGYCKFGHSGKSGGVCKYRHPKVCKKYTNYGRFSPNGCQNADCKKWHPRICYTGVNTGVCVKKNCPYFHGSQVRRDMNHGTANTNRHGVDNAEAQSIHDDNENDKQLSSESSNVFLDVVASLRREMQLWKSQIIEATKASQNPCYMPPTQGQHLLGMNSRNAYLSSPYQGTQNMFVQEPLQLPANQFQ